MARTLLAGHPQCNWSEWIQDELGSRQFVSLAVNSPQPNSLARVALHEGDKTLAYRFVGSTDPLRNPIAILSGLHELLQMAEDDTPVLSFEYRPQPVLRQLLEGVVTLCQPTKILIPESVDYGYDLWPIGPEEIALPQAFPDLVRTAQRRARWIELLENSTDHELDLSQVKLTGARIGSGKVIAVSGLSQLGFEDILWAEVLGGIGLVVIRKPIDEERISELLNYLHVSRVQFVEPNAYSGRLCSFARADGEDFAMGVIEEMDFKRQIIKIRAQAIAPAPAKVLKLGLTTIDSSGRELHEPQPWAV
ncbi:MAG: hypothetical protein JST40_00020 [Armatimonadetes bacterium]|nr:hypothetical protein [Armatimonadota bacterium]